MKSKINTTQQKEIIKAIQNRITEIKTGFDMTSDSLQHANFCIKEGITSGEYAEAYEDIIDGIKFVYAKQIKSTWFYENNKIVVKIDNNPEDVVIEDVRFS